MNKKYAALLASLAGVVIFFISFSSIRESVRIKKLGASVESTVESIYRPSKGPKKVTVKFITSDGTEVKATGAYRQILFTGNKVKIWYDPADPQKIDFGDTVRYNMRGVIIGLLWFSFLFYFFVKISLQDRANKKLRSTGRKVPAEIVYTGRNEKHNMGKGTPWIIKCKWTEGSTNKEYTFVSKDFTTDPTPHLAGKSHLDVYINPADPSKYFFDTSFMPDSETIG